MAIAKTKVRNPTVVSNSYYYDADHRGAVRSRPYSAITFARGMRLTRALELAGNNPRGESKEIK